MFGFDKTFNLGSMYVTPSVYKNGALHVMQSNGCMNNPLFYDPFLYTDIQTLRHIRISFRTFLPVRPVCYSHCSGAGAAGAAGAVFSYTHNSLLK